MSDEHSLRAREIMTAVVNDDYDLARSLMGEMLERDTDDISKMLQAVFQLNRFIMEWWAEQNQMPLPELWQEFSEYMVLHQKPEEE